MAKIIVQNFKEAGDSEELILYVQGWQAYSPSKAAATLKRILAAYKAMWPDCIELNKIHIVELDK